MPEFQDLFISRQYHGVVADNTASPDGRETNTARLTRFATAVTIINRNRFQPGTTIPRHKHTGEVFAVTFSGSWKYLEYPEVNTAGSYLFEPAGSIHTLTVPETNTEITDVWFAIRGANLNLDDDGNVVSVVDAQVVRDVYLAMCEERGLPRPNVIGA